MSPVVYPVFAPARAPAPDARFGVDQLLWPVERARFAQEYLERKPLVLQRGPRDHHAALLSQSELESFLTIGRPSYSKVFAIDARRPIATDEFVGAHAEIDPLRLFRLMETGATIVCREVEAHFAGLAGLCHSAEFFLNSRFQANVYWAPAGGQAFPAHYDARDVYALQISGSKRWRVYGVHRVLPQRDEHCRDALETTEPTLDITLHPGDALYLPRGFVHLAQATDEASLHVSLITFPTTWADVLADALAQCCADDPAFRAGLPPGFFHDDGALANVFADLAARFAASARLAPALAAARRRLVIGCNPAPPDLRSQARLAERLDQNSEIVADPEALYTIDEEPGVVALRGFGKEIRFAAEAADDLRACLNAPRGRVRELPGRLDPASRLELCRTLVAHGFLLPADAV